MAGEWKTVPLTNLYDIGSGLSKPRSEFGSGQGFLTFKDVLDNFFVPDQLSALVNSTEKEQENCSVMRGDVFLTRTSETQPELGMSSVALKDYPKATFNGFTKRLRPKTRDAVVPEYAAYYFRGPRFRQTVTSMSSLSTRASLNNEMIARLSIVLPPVPEQKAIGIVLKALDDKIELNRRRNRTLEAMARAIFQSWFVDFDPVKAKAAGRTPPSLSPALAALFPDSFTDSPLGPIPASWRVGSVGDVADFNAWTLGKRDGLDVIDYIEISEVMHGEIANITRYNRGTEPGRARRRLRHGDTAISTVRPDRGSYFLSIDPSLSLLASTGFAVLSSKNGHWAFVHVLVTRDEFGQELGRLADGGAYPAVRPEVIAARPVVIPAESELLTNFEKVAQPLFLHSEASRKESRSLAALRNAMLPKLISGELRVPDAERIAGRFT